MPEEPLIDKGLLEKLERLTIRWQKSFPGLVGGHTASRYPGPGLEFLEHRNFYHGDDLRAVNWRAYMRFEKLFMKMFHVEPRIPVRLLLDISLSMATAQGSKFDCARRLAAALCYIGLVRLDSLVVFPFHDRLDDAFICSGGRHSFGPTADFLSALKPSGATRLNDVVRSFTEKHRQRGLLIVISDFLGEEDFTKPLELLASFGHELCLLQVWDEADRVPPWSGRLELVDAESGATRVLEIDNQARQAYTEAFDVHARTLERIAASSNGRFAGLSTAESLESALFGPIARVGGLR